MKRSTVTGALFASATLGLLAAPPRPAAAQDTPAGVEEARRVATCLHHEDTEMQRIIRLMADAQHRATSASAETVDMLPLRAAPPGAVAGHFLPAAMVADDLDGEAFGALAASAVRPVLR
jgi:hypothetical protein